MAQHSYVIDNASGAAVRADINSALQAVLTNNSGTVPGTTAAYMLWADSGSSPDLLKIRDSADGAWITLCEIVSGGIGTIASGQFYVGDGTVSAPGLAFKDDASLGLRRNAADTLSIVTDGADRVTVDSSGNVGIGVTPSTDLHIQRTANAVVQITSGSTSKSTIRLGDTDAVSVGKIQYDNSNNSLAFDTNSSTRLTIISDGKIGIAETTPTEILHVNGNIKGTGNIFIGDTGAPHAVTGTDEKTRLLQNQISVAANADAGLRVNRLGNDGKAVRFYRSGVEVGNISVTGSATAYNESSDYRLKENIVDIADGISRVKQLQPKRFNFIVDPDTTVDGFIAHEAQTVVPESVTGTHDEVDEDGNPVMQGIDKSKIVPLLTAALQEAIAKIETLEAKVAALEASS